MSEPKFSFEAVRTFKMPDDYHFGWATTRFTECLPWADVEGLVNHYGKHMMDISAEFLTMVGPDMLGAIDPTKAAGDDTPEQIANNFAMGRWGNSFGDGELCKYQLAPGNCEQVFAETFEIIAAPDGKSVEFVLQSVNYSVKDRSNGNLETTIDVGADSVELMMRLLGGFTFRVKCLVEGEAPQMLLDYELTGSFAESEKVQTMMRRSKERNEMVNTMIMDGADPRDIKAKLDKLDGVNMLAQLKDLLGDIGEDLDNES